MENIFKGAKFGDKFVTTYGKIVIFYYLGDNRAFCVSDSIKTPLMYNLDGKFSNEILEEFNIVSKYQETIDENKLDELPEQLCSEGYSYRE